MPSDWKEGFPPALREHDLFPELVGLVERITGHPAMRLSRRYVLRNMVQASLGFTVCFYGHVWGAFQGVFETEARRGPFGVQGNLTDLYVLLELGREELTDELPGRNHRGPHYVMLLDAAKSAGVDTAQMELLVRLLTGPYTLGAGFEDALNSVEIAQELRDYLSFSHKLATMSTGTAMTTLALRELTLAQSFRVIIQHLPTEPKYDGVRAFFSRHVAVDEGMHGPLMSKWLETRACTPRLATTCLNDMLDFYTLRLRVYDRCLQRTKLY